MPLEALGQAQAAAGHFDDALQTLAEALKIEPSKNVRFRIVLGQIEILRRAGRDEDALKKVSDALGEYRSEKQETALGQLALILRPPPPPPPPDTTPKSRKKK
jgi:cytochrome c-type biogenesis protein CcmH/NrfG